jgi:hypothetical protein
MAYGEYWLKANLGIHGAAIWFRSKRDRLPSRRIKKKKDCG